MRGSRGLGEGEGGVVSVTRSRGGASTIVDGSTFILQKSVQKRKLATLVALPRL